MNGTKVYKGQSYYFDDFYFAENNTIVGIKDIKSENSTDALFLMLFDIMVFCRQTVGGGIFTALIFMTAAESSRSVLIWI